VFLFHFFDVADAPLNPAGVEDHVAACQKRYYISLRKGGKIVLFFSFIIMKEKNPVVANT
jgi:hypothetical protein